MPSGNRPINGGEQEYRWLARCRQEIGLIAVGDGAGWCTCLRLLTIRISRRVGREISVSCKTFERSVILPSGDTFWIEKAWLASPEPAPEELPDTLQNQEREIIEGPCGK